jgi:hypothetical protein
MGWRQGRRANFSQIKKRKEKRKMYDKLKLIELSITEPV